MTARATSTYEVIAAQTFDPVWLKRQGGQEEGKPFSVCLIQAKGRITILSWHGSHKLANAACRRLRMSEPVR